MGQSSSECCSPCDSECIDTCCWSPCNYINDCIFQFKAGNRAAELEKAEAMNNHNNREENRQNYPNAIEMMPRNSYPKSNKDYESDMKNPMREQFKSQTNPIRSSNMGSFIQNKNQHISTKESHLFSINSPQKQHIPVIQANHFIEIQRQKGQNIPQSNQNSAQINYQQMPLPSLSRTNHLFQTKTALTKENNVSNRISNTTPNISFNSPTQIYSQNKPLNQDLQPPFPYQIAPFQKISSQKIQTLDIQPHKLRPVVQQERKIPAPQEKDNSDTLQAEITRCDNQLKQVLERKNSEQDLAFAYAQCCLANRILAPSKAIECGLRALNLYKSLPINSFFEEVITVQNNLGFIYAATGNYGTAIKQFEEVMQLHKRYYSRFDNRVIATQNSLALARSSLQNSNKN